MHSIAMYREAKTFHAGENLLMAPGRLTTADCQPDDVREVRRISNTVCPEDTDKGGELNEQVPLRTTRRVH